MKKVKNIIIADPNQTGASLRRELKDKKLPKVFFSKQQSSSIEKPKTLRSYENELHWKNVALSKGENVLDVTETSKGILIRTKY